MNLVEKKRKSDSEAAMKIRNERRKEKDDQNVSGNLRFYVPSENGKVQIFDMIDGYHSQQRRGSKRSLSVLYREQWRGAC